MCSTARESSARRNSRPPRVQLCSCHFTAAQLRSARANKRLRAGGHISLPGSRAAEHRLTGERAHLCQVSPCGRARQQRRETGGCAAKEPA